MQNSGETLFKFSLQGYAIARTLHFLTQLRTLEFYTRFLSAKPLSRTKVSRELERKLIKSLLEVVLRDAERAAKGAFPTSLIFPENPKRYLSLFPAVFLDALKIHQRRMKGEWDAFSEEAKIQGEALPKYFKRNFHFQTDGYLSAQSASLYDHQVEILFAGAAAAMRRMCLLPLTPMGGDSRKSPLKILEISAGTGATTRMLAKTFPHAQIVVTDISSPYLDSARERLKMFSNLDFQVVDATQLPFAEESFDAVVSVFLFHELPLDERKKVISEAKRVLKNRGVVSIVDSLQLGDISDFDVFLKDFPKNYHEPFFNDYIKNPLEDILAENAFQMTSQETGFFAKAIGAVKNFDGESANPKTF